MDVFPYPTLPKKQRWNSAALQHHLRFFGKVGDGWPRKRQAFSKKKQKKTKKNKKVQQAVNVLK